ncbi:MAG: glycine--tRNA ligase subunit beta [Pseudomonadota bacterium]
MPDLLLELFSEEIPARMQARAAEDLKRLVTDAMVEAGLTYGAAGVAHTPRRLTLSLEGVAKESPTQVEERKGPRKDAPEKALDGFLRATGLSLEDLEVRPDKKGEVYFATLTKPGRPAEEILAQIIPSVITNFPWPKSMRWGAGALRWVRPLQSILCILSDEAGHRVVPFEVAGLNSGDVTYGHRFLAPKPLQVTGFDSYEAALSRAHVILSAQARADMIWSEATNMAFAQGLEVVQDPGLLAEVANLVEWPVVLMGQIGAGFLDLPAEVLQTSMREHQKFFSVRNPKTGRIERFVTVANIETADNGATILAGNEKVLSARLSDAKFFWENDLRAVTDHGMEGMAAPLAEVTFHNKLGSQAERIGRITALAQTLAPLVGADGEEAAQAARIAKADLSSEMVYEFPELQGVMGRYYAKAAGHSPAIADAAERHYAPLGPSDAVPDEPMAMAVALADKLDMLAGFWAIDEKPTGSKDPFALRRAALGVIRIVLENGVRLHLLPLIAQAHAGADAQDVLGFIAERLKVYLRGQGTRHDVIDAAYQAGGQDDLVRVTGLIAALQAFMATEDGENLVQGYKRANNILTAEEKKDGVEYSLDPDPKFAETDVERVLFAALDTAEPQIAQALAAEDFEAAMASLAKLRQPIDGFFDGTQVNAENPILRRNRLCLLHKIRSVMNTVAIFSSLDG